jgi:hypothetical protein
MPITMNGRNDRGRAATLSVMGGSGGSFGGICGWRS